MFFRGAMGARLTGGGGAGRTKLQVSPAAAETGFCMLVSPGFCGVEELGAFSWGSSGTCEGALVGRDSSGAGMSAAAGCVS